VPSALSLYGGRVEVTMLFADLVKEMRALHKAFNTNPCWAKEDADALFSGEQAVFVWSKYDGGFITVALVIHNNKLRSRVVHEQE
jgi:hypothetical protein